MRRRRADFTDAELANVTVPTLSSSATTTSPGRASRWPRSCPTRGVDAAATSTTSPRPSRSASSTPRSSSSTPSRPERRHARLARRCCSRGASSPSRPRRSTAWAPTRPTRPRCGGLRGQGPTCGPPADRPHRVRRAARGWAADVPPAAARLATTCWPGPLTLLVPRAAHVLDIVTGGRDTVGLRVPAHPLTLDLLAPLRRRRRRAVGQPLRAGVADHGRARPRATSARSVDVILDGGPCPIGVESTIVDCTVSRRRCCAPAGSRRADRRAARRRARRLVRAEPGTGDARRPLRAALPRGAGLVGRRRRRRSQRRSTVGSTSSTARADLAAYAQSLYAALRDADDRGLDVLVAVLPPPTGLGHAIRDRLAKAAAGSGAT